MKIAYVRTDHIILTRQGFLCTSWPWFKRQEFAANSIYCSPFCWVTENEHSFLFANNRRLAIVTQLFIVTICAVIAVQLHRWLFARVSWMFPVVRKNGLRITCLIKAQSGLRIFLMRKLSNKNVHYCIMFELFNRTVQRTVLYHQC